MEQSGIIYYTDNRVEEPIYSIVQKQLLKAQLPIVSSSLKPIHFGFNILVPLEPCYLTMLKQIELALRGSTAGNVFFCEHDVLYPKSHFDFVPPFSYIFYYNDNVWRWDYPKDRAISYERLISLSGLCVNRNFALKHYQARIAKIEKEYLNEQQNGNPKWARAMGHEPGTKKKKRGGFSDDDYETWSSEEPMIDIRHKGTFSPPKVTLRGFTHLPKTWKETTLDEIKGWNLKELFNL